MEPTQLPTYESVLGVGLDGPEQFKFQREAAMMKADFNPITRRHLLIGSVIVLSAVTLGPLQARDGVGRLQLWNVPGEGRGMPAADSSTAYFLSKRHEAVAIDASSGRLRWRQNTGESGEVTQGSAVAIAGPNVVVGDYNVIGFDRITGLHRWTFSPTDGYAPGIYLGAAANGLVFTGSPAGRIYAVDALTGRQRWSTVVADDSKTTVYQPLTEQRIVAASYTTFSVPPVGGVAVFEAATGRLRWRRPFPPSTNLALGTNTTGSLVLTEKSVIAPSGNGEITAFDPDTGSIQWSIPKMTDVPKQLGSADFDIRPVARIGRTLFAGSLFGYVIAYDLDTRHEIWRYDGSSHGSVNLIITTDDRTLYVPFLGSRLVALSAFDGKERWVIGDSKTPFTWPALAFGKHVYAASSQAGFFAFARDVN